MFIRPPVECINEMHLLLFWLLMCVSVAAGDNAANWSSNYPPCNQHSALLQRGHLDLGVRLATANLSLAEQFRRALDSWASILDLDWHEDDTENCSIQLIDGKRELFQPAAIAARSQLPDRLDFQGCIAFNPAQTLTNNELYRIAVHEIGHILGLRHSANITSVMYGLDVEGLEWLDLADLKALATHHKLRITTLDKPVKLIQKH
jgi:hypothetical protein